MGKTEEGQERQRREVERQNLRLADKEDEKAKEGGEEAGKEGEVQVEDAREEGKVPEEEAEAKTEEQERGAPEDEVPVAELGKKAWVDWAAQRAARRRSNWVIDEGVEEEERGNKRARKGPESEEKAEELQAEDEWDTDIVMGLRKVEFAKLVEQAPDIAEVYSPPRVSEEGIRWGLKPGEAMDLTTGWDFRSRAQRDRAWQYLEEKKPKLLIGSPMCTLFSQLQNLSGWGPDKQERWVEAVGHMRFVIDLYRRQMREGRLFLHEHPAGATSWGLEMVKKLLEEEGVFTTVADQCEYGLETTTQDRKGRVPARKRTRFATNVWMIAQELGRKCSGTHDHGPLIGDKRASNAARYPQGLCEAICRGLLAEQKLKRECVRRLMSLRVGDQMPRDDGHMEEEMGEAWDDVTGAELDWKEVRKARATEIGYVREKRVWVKIPRAVAISRGWKIIKTRWIDINKGDMLHPNYRSRFVGKEFNNGVEDGLFAATPPLEAVRALVGDMATVEDGTEEAVLMINDIARAFFEAATGRNICIELPEEDRVPGEGDMVGKLQMSLYGTRDAAANFQAEVKKFMTGLGFAQGKYNPCTYWHKERGIRTLVHGDDFISKAGRSQAQWFKRKLEGRFEIKTKVVGSAKVEAQEERVLNRVVRITPEGWEYEPDQRHVDVLVRSMNLTEAKPVQTPWEDARPWKAEEEGEKLKDKDARDFRSLVARANYLALDRGDIQYATKEVCRGMASPTVGDHRKLKRLVRYLLGRPRVVTKFPWQREPEKVEGFSDSDYAGCRRTAKSTSGGALLIGRHCVKTWSSTQKSVTLSSGEAELVAAVKTSTEVLGILQLLADWGRNFEGVILVDSSAALGVVKRKGNGKMRHIKVGMLWIQEMEEMGELGYEKVDGEWNCADLMTKGVPPKWIQRHGEKMGLEFRSGRAEAGLEATG